MRNYFKLLLALAVTLTACECPYLESESQSDYEYYRRTGYDRLTADRLPGLWQCYYPMIVGNVEFKEVRLFSNGKADIIMEKRGGSAYYAETFSWRYDGRYLSFTQGNLTYQFQITGYLSPELYLRDSYGKYIKEIYIPETVSFIGEDAFEGCTALQGIYYDEVDTTSRSVEADAASGDSEEIARYDLSGRPCSPTTKGVQIIVYSDYTTRTIIAD